jgi:hypothetical protein
MSDDFLVLTNEEKGVVGGVPECLVVDSRKIVRQGLMANVDDEDALTTAVSYPASLKAHDLSVVYAVDEGSFKSVKRGHRQIGFIRREAIASSPGESGRKHFAVIPVTAKHNLRRWYDDKTRMWADAQSASIWLRAKQPAEEIQVMFDSLNWRPGATDTITLRGDSKWEYGSDVSFGRKVSQRKDGMTNEFASFELVRPDFQLKKNQNIAIVVYFAEEAAPNKTTISADAANPLNYTNDEIQELYGKPLQPNIYTGTITRAEENEEHIEYDINTFTGCSGAIVFLLDKQEPGSGVEERDHGKAIAIHAGRHPGLLDRNFGFALKEAMLPDS